MAINVSVLILIVLVSGSNMNFSNWALPPKEGCGTGGFIPYGLGSIWTGVNKVFYAYIGFDAAGHAGNILNYLNRINTIYKEKFENAYSQNMLIVYFKGPVSRIMRTSMSILT